MDLTYEIPAAMSRTGRILIPSLIGYKCVPNTDPDSYYDIAFYSGGFCQSYPLYKVGTTKKKCLRLWTDEKTLKSNIQHVKRISKYFAEHRVEHVVNYDYYESALRLNDGTVIPGVVMDWIEGSTLISYIRTNYLQSNKIFKIAREFLLMEKYMDSNGFAHGDLSGDNIMVDSSDRLILIDYDSFYVKSITEGVIQSTAGIPCYQHPGRASNTYLSQSMDNFSQLVIYCSLMAIARYPSLFNPDTDKGLLFQIEDMISEKAFISSSIYRKMKNVNDGLIDHYLEIIASCLNGPFGGVPSLNDYYSLNLGCTLSFMPYCCDCGLRYTTVDQRFCYKCGKRRDGFSEGYLGEDLNENILMRILKRRGVYCSSCGYFSERFTNYCGNCGKPHYGNAKEVDPAGTEKMLNDIITKYEKNPTISVGLKLIREAIKNILN